MIAPLFIIGIGVLFCWLSVSEWQNSSDRKRVRMAVKVVSHAVELDRIAWEGRELEPIRLTSVVARTDVDSLEQAGGTKVLAWFESGEVAWEAAHQRPVGTMQECFFEPALGQGVWEVRQFPLGAFLMGMVACVIGIAIATCNLRWVDRLMPIVIGVVLLIGGGVMFAQAFTENWQKIQASDWPTVTTNAYGTKRLRKGKSGSERTAFRYQWQGTHYDTVAIGELPADGTCRVNPAKPWEARATAGLDLETFPILVPLALAAAGATALILAFRQRKKPA